MGVRARGRLAQRLARSVSLVVGCAVALAGCGDDGPETTTAGDTVTSSTTPAAAPGPPSALRREFNELVTDALTSAEGLSPAVARCAVTDLERSISDAELRAALQRRAETGEVPTEVIDAAFDAGVECAAK